MTKKYFFIFVLVHSYFGSFLYSENFYMSMQKEQAVNTVLNEAANVISNCYNMRCVGSGGAMMYEVERLKLTFSVHRPLSKNEARKIIVDSAETFLRIINNDNSLKKYLKNEHFELEDISLAILIYNYDGAKIYHPYLSTVILTKGDIEYLTDDKSSEWKYQEETEEPFEEAKRILEQQK